MIGRKRLVEYEEFFKRKYTIHYWLVDKGTLIHCLRKCTLIFKCYTTFLGNGNKNVEHMKFKSF